MKNFLLLFMLFILFFIKKGTSQTICVAADCKTTIQLPQDTISLNGKVTANNTISSTKWKLISGPNTPTITNTNSITTPITSLIPGTYIFSLTATDIKNNTANTLDTLIVLTAQKPPIATIKAYPGQTITLPADTIMLDGTSIPSGAPIKKWWWSTGDTTKIIHKLYKQAGTYGYYMAVTDSMGLSDTTFSSVTVLPAPIINNKIPVAIIKTSADTITLPVNTITLNGSSSIDSDGTIIKYTWSSGDTTKIINPTFGAAGTYIYSLTVTDNAGATNTTSVSIVVNPSPVLPPVITIEGNSNVNSTIDTLTATAFDPNDGGSIKQYGWGKLAGPGIQTIIGANTAKPIITGLQSGTYQFKCTVWNAAGLTNNATITLNVNQTTTKTIVKIIVYYSDGTTTQFP